MCFVYPNVMCGRTATAWVLTFIMNLHRHFPVLQILLTCALCRCTLFHLWGLICFWRQFAVWSSVSPTPDNLMHLASAGFFTYVLIPTCSHKKLYITNIIFKSLKKNKNVCCGARLPGLKSCPGLFIPQTSYLEMRIKIASTMLVKKKITFCVGLWKIYIKILS